MTETRIRWEDTAAPSLATWVGHIGTIKPPLFEIQEAMLVPERWVLIPGLPGLERERYFGADPDELKAEAERWLEQFVVSLGAIFPEKRTCPSCYGGGHDGTVNRNDCPTCKGSGDVLRVPDEPPKETGQ